MPKVPYNGQTQVDPQGLSQVRQSDAGATPEAFGAGVAQGNEALGEGLQRSSYQLYKVKQTMDERMVVDAETSYQTYLKDALVGTPDKPGYYSNKGTDAVTKLPGVQKDLETTRVEIRDKIGSAAARAAFDAKSKQLVTNHLERTGAYATEQNDVALDASLKGQQKAAADHAAAFATDLREVGNAMEMGADAALKRADRAGIRDDATRAQIVSDAHSGVLRQAMESLVAGDKGDQAQALYDKVGSLLTGDDKIAVDKMMQSMTLTKFSQDATDYIVAKFPLKSYDDKGNLVVNYKARDEAIQYIHDHYSGKQEDEVLKEFSARMGEQDKIVNGEYYQEERIGRSVSNALLADERQLRADQKRVQAEVFGGIRSGMTYEQVILKMQAEGRGPDADIANGLNPTQFATAEMVHAKGEIYSPTDTGMYTELTHMTTTELANLNLADYLGALTEPQYRLIARQQTQAQAALNNRDKVYYSQAERALAKVGNVKDGWGKTVGLTQDQIAAQEYPRQELQARISEAVEQGHKPTEKEIWAWAREAATPVRTETAVYRATGGLLGSYKKPTSAAQAKATWTETEKKNVAIPKASIDPGILGAITESLKIHGVANPSDALIEHMAGRIALGRLEGANGAEGLVAEAMKNAPGWIPPAAAEPAPVAGPAGKGGKPAAGQ